MKRIQTVIAILLLLFLPTATVAADTPKTTNITVVAHEYYEYYTMPDEEKWKKVKSIKIEGSRSSGSAQAYQDGPGSTLEVTLYDITVSSEYWVTVVWENDEKISLVHSPAPAAEGTHHIPALLRAVPLLLHHSVLN